MLSLLLLISIFFQHLQTTYPKHTEKPPIVAKQPIVFEPQYISIPRLRLFLPVEQAQIIDEQWILSDKKTAFFGSGSALPGTSGTTVIFAHARNGLFAQLALLKTGDTIVITSKDSAFIYSIESEQLVTPLETDFIKTDGENTLAIFTCFGALDQKRIVFLGKLSKITRIPKISNTLYHI